MAKTISAGARSVLYGLRNGSIQLGLEQNVGALPDGLIVGTFATRGMPRQAVPTPADSARSPPLYCPPSSAAAQSIARRDQSAASPRSCAGVGRLQSR